MKKTVITGVSGQDGSYLAEYLVSLSYEVHGVCRDANKASVLFANLDNKITIHQFDILDYDKLESLIKTVQPDGMYHLASTVEPRVLTDNIDIFYTDFNSTYNILQIIKKYSPKTKVFFAGSSTVYGGTSITPQNEYTAFDPLSPYAISKASCFHYVKMFREYEGLYVCTGILYNHESPRRSIKFIPRKITYNTSRIGNGLIESFDIGDITSCRDWGFAKDYVIAMREILQEVDPDDYIIGSGIQHTIEDILEIAFGFIGLNWQNHVCCSNRYFRKDNNNLLVADISKITSVTSWKPKTSFANMINIMMENDIKLTLDKENV